MRACFLRIRAYRAQSKLFTNLFGASNTPFLLPALVLKAGVCDRDEVLAVSESIVLAIPKP